MTIRRLSAREAAAMLGVSRSRVQALARAGRLGPVQHRGDHRTAPMRLRACCVRAQRDRETCGVCSGETAPHPDDRA